MDLTLISLFCVIDDFCQELLPQWNAILLEDTNKSSMVKYFPNSVSYNRFVELIVSVATSVGILHIQ
ncbi:hypothetical protein Psal073_00763 [Piscirickettsia salmonis]|uniref:hypothetical protein n=1 Tax=Piscirickettsia salmonis TaxID=1238 RepID=UPI002045D99B|nr:hypothetical protein Psal073_00763 [Piscirickettsia salmonis]